MVFIREKKTDCANYREVDIIPRTEAAEQAARGKRGKKRKVNAPKQKDLNDKNAKRYLVQLGNGNFHIGTCISVRYNSADRIPSYTPAFAGLINTCKIIHWHDLHTAIPSGFKYNPAR